MPVRIIESDRTENDRVAGFTDDLGRNLERTDIAAKFNVMAPDFYVHRIERVFAITNPRASKPRE
jgi:hypothetical protein